MPSSREKLQPFSEHLSELRSRLLSSAVFFIIGTIFGYLLHERILAVLIAPLGQPVFYSSPAGGFDFLIKLSFLFGLAISIPVLVFHTLRFIEPVLPPQSPRKMLLVLVSSCLLLIAGVLFAYFVSLPAALYFLGSFTSEGVQALISASDYFSFVTRYLLGFGLLFQLPLVLLVINSVQRIPIGQLLGLEKWVVLLSFVVAAVLTPTPDIFNQLLMALPLIALYQITVVLVWLVNSRTRQVRGEID
ncbi:MAG TPA: twin-arginine translocase subunit TatC [Bellilinea sp.]|nr:twin-arginine translocase subunit TatC [Bellilinea sp.]